MTVEQNQSDSLSPAAKRKSQFTKLFLLVAIGLGIAGGIHFFSIISSGFTSIRLADAIYNSVLGIVVFICSKLLEKGNRLVIYLMGAVGVAAVLYSFIMGRGFNFIMVIVVGFFVWQLLTLAKAGEIR
jgi:hypothetical protein